MTFVALIKKVKQTKNDHIVLTIKWRRFVLLKLITSNIEQHLVDDIFQFQHAMPRF